MNFNILHRAIQPHEVEWRIQRASAENTTVVPYLTNRCVMARFDEEFGPQGWQNSFTEWRQKGVKCGISVKIENEWITKYDGADESDRDGGCGGGYGGNVCGRDGDSDYIMMVVAIVTTTMAMVTGVHGLCLLIL
jgi:hypothetical protein